MSKISEYLALIPKGIPNALDIVKAIKINSQMEHGSLPKDKLNEIIDIISGNVVDHSKWKWMFSNIFIERSIDYFKFIKRKNEIITVEII